MAALRGLAYSATTPAHLELLASKRPTPTFAGAGSPGSPSWGGLADSDVDGMLADDPNPDAWMRALQVRTARPTAEAKAEAWQAVLEDRKIPPGVIGRVGRSFWRPGQEDLLAPYAEKFLAALPRIGDAGMSPGP